MLPYTLTLWRCIRQWRPDVVHCDSSRGVLLIGLAARLAQRPVVWHVQSEEVVLAANAHLNRFVAGLATVAARCADSLTAGILPDLPATTIHYGIEANSCPADVRQQSDALLVERGLEPGRTTRLLTAASMTPYKGLHHLAAGLRELIEERPELSDRVAWFVLGDARSHEAQEYRAFLADLVCNHRLERNVFWLGWRDDPVAWIDATEIVVIPTVLKESFVFPGRSPIRLTSTEGLPLTLLEAMRVGRPVLATDVGGVRDVLENGQTGLLVAPGSADALKRGLALLLDHPERRREMGEAAKARSSHFTAERMVSEFSALYRSIAQVN